MKCVNLTGTLEVFLLFSTLSSVHRSHLLLLYALCCIWFCFNTRYEFTPPPNLRPVIFVSKLLAGMFTFICLVYYGIYMIDVILIYALFSGIQLGHKTRPWSICNRSRRRPFTFLLLTVSK